MATSTATWTFPDSGTQASFWEDYCAMQSVTYANASEAETNGIARLKTILANDIANYRAQTAAAVEQSSTYTSEYSNTASY